MMKSFKIHFVYNMIFDGFLYFGVARNKKLKKHFTHLNLPFFQNKSLRADMHLMHIVSRK